MTASTALPAKSASDTAPLRLAMLGMIEGNGHPYSWSAIINGYDPEAMARCPFSVIPKYLGAQPRQSVRVPGAQVTHIWTDNPAEASAVAAASLIPNVVAQPTDVIGHVDAVLIATDDGFDHVRRVEPFLRAGLPVFVDKPLALKVHDLREFVGWHRTGARLQSSSGLRYAPELDTLFEDRPVARRVPGEPARSSKAPGGGSAGMPRSSFLNIGEVRWAAATTCKTWERYAIHVLEPVYRLLGPGFESVRLETPGSPMENKTEVAHLVHHSGVQCTLPVMYDGGHAHGLLTLCGTAGIQSVRFTDTYTAFRRQMLSFIDFVRSGTIQYPFAETIELMCVLIAGIRSRAEQSRRVTVAEIQSEL